VLNHKIVKPVFAVVVALLFIGPQVRTHGQRSRVSSACCALWSLVCSNCMSTACSLHSAASSIASGQQQRQQNTAVCTADTTQQKCCTYLLFSSHLPPAPCQDREHNFCLSFFWNYWWPLMFIAYPFLGRIW
jgi:hypothetical protein